MSKYTGVASANTMLSHVQPEEVAKNNDGKPTCNLSCCLLPDTPHAESPLHGVSKLPFKAMLLAKEKTPAALRLSYAIFTNLASTSCLALSVLHAAACQAHHRTHACPAHLTRARLTPQQYPGTQNRNGTTSISLMLSLSSAAPPLGVQHTAPTGSPTPSAAPTQGNLTQHAVASRQFTKATLPRRKQTHATF